MRVVGILSCSALLEEKSRHPVDSTLHLSLHEPMMIYESALFLRPQCLRLHVLRSRGALILEQLRLQRGAAHLQSAHRGLQRHLHDLIVLLHLC